MSLSWKFNLLTLVLFPVPYVATVLIVPMGGKNQVNESRVNIDGEITVRDEGKMVSIM